MLTLSRSPHNKPPNQRAPQPSSFHPFDGLILSILRLDPFQTCSSRAGSSTRTLPPAQSFHWGLGGYCARSASAHQRALGSWGVLPGPEGRGIGWIAPASTLRL